MHLKNHQKTLKESILFLNGQDYFNNYVHAEISLDESIQKRIRETMYNAYWDMLQTQLEADPPEYDQLLRILQELRELFCKFVPNVPELQEEIKDKIDPELLKNMITHQAFDDENLFNLATYIISLIKRFQPPVMDDDINNWEITMLNELKNDFNHSTFLVTFFKSVFNMIHSIIFYITES